MKIYDISMELKEGMIAYSNNTDFKIKQVNFIPNSNTNESLLSFSTHTGTHVDSPRHINNKGKTVDQIPLGNLIGKCRVIDLTNIIFEIKKEDIVKFKIKRNEIILLKTRNSKFFNKFNENYIHLGFDAAKYLALKKIRCVGIDYLSIQKFHSGTQEVHRILLSNNVAIIEGLDLSNVNAGNYQLVCLPLRLIGTDGAPARAVLIKNY